MEPRVTKRERKLHLSYDLPHRVHCAHIYPIAAPTGSSIVLYGHDRGLRILWRGGRRRKETAQAPPESQSNGRRKEPDVIVIDDDDEEDAPPPKAETSAQGQYEDAEDELDQDCPYPAIIQAVDVDLDTEVLHLAIPSTPSSSSSRTTQALRSHAVVAVACADGSQKVLHFPLSPPNNQTTHEFAEHIAQTLVDFPSAGSFCHALAARIITPEILDRDGDSQARSFLHVAAASDKLEIRRFSIFNELTTISQDVQYQAIPLPHRPTGVSFHPSQSSTQLLVADVSGAVRIYDPYAPTSSIRRPSSADSTLEGASGQSPLGKWVVAFLSPFSSGKAGLAKRKHIIEAKWVLNGKAVLALLADGEWGMWDVCGTSHTSKNVESFVLSGFLGASAVSESTEPAKQRRGASKLAPMTPNTRKAKAEVLFSGPPKVSGVAARGGISIATSSNRTGQTDESVIMWYNSDIYSIPSLQAFWQRSTSNNGGLGSLYSPGLTHITDINLMNETITSIYQFPSTTPSSSLGQINTQRDLLVSAESRLIILQTLRPSTPAKALFQQAISERPTSRDQRMLDEGDLGLDGMNRMLDGMANGDARPRRVGFAR